MTHRPADTRLPPHPPSPNWGAVVLVIFLTGLGLLVLGAVAFG